MAERIEYPSRPAGTAEEQLEMLYTYLYRMAETLNLNLTDGGQAFLTDTEQQLMNQLTIRGTSSQTEEPMPFNYQEQQTLKSLIIKTAQFVKTSIDQYKMALYGDTEAQSDMGTYRRKTGLRVDMTPDGIKQTYSFAEIVQGLKTFEINAKNYIKTGLLRTEQSLPVYGVAIGKDVVTFSEDGTETYNDSNKVAELTADELSFYHNGALLAKYAGDRTSFYQNGEEIMYISGGKIYATDDMYIGSGKTVYIGDWRFNANGMTFYESDSPLLQLGKASAKLNDVEAGVFVDKEGENDPAVLFHVHSTGYIGNLRLERCGGNGVCLHPDIYSQISLGSENMGKFLYLWVYNILASYGQIDTVSYIALVQRSSREIKHDIEDMPEMGNRLDQLRPVTFVYDDDPDEKKRYGLVYEETEEVMPEICSGDEGNKTLNYVEMVPMLLKEIQSLRARVSELEGRN